MQRSVYLGALVISLFMAATVAVPVVVVDVPANEDAEPSPQPTVSDTNFELLGENQVPRRRIDEGTGFESGENVNGVAGNGPSTDSTAAETNIRGYCRCYEIPGGYELCVTVVYEETEEGELVARKRRFVRSISRK